MSGLIAIDFGTSRTKLAYAKDGGRPELLRFNRDRPYTPSLFYLPAQDGPVQFGDAAETALERDPAGVIALVKRRLREPRIRVRNRSATPSELLALMLTTLRHEAGHKIAAFNGRLPDAVVLTVPAGFDGGSIDLLETAAHSVGFTRVEVMPEPVAAARAWLVEAGGAADRLVVLDCGGGTVDWAYLVHKAGRFRVVPSCPPGGIADRGGHDVDLGLFDLIQSKLVTLGKAIESTRVLRLLAELRVLKETVAQGDAPVAVAIDDVSLSLTVGEIRNVIETRFVTATIDGLRPYLDKVQAESAEQPLPPVLLAGGSSRLPGLREAIEKSGYRVVDWDRADYAPALGALTQAASTLDGGARFRRNDLNVDYSETDSSGAVSARRRVVREAVSILGQLAAVANRNDFREIESDILAEVACLSEEHVELAVTGRFCVGKSTFLNALLNSSGPVGEAGMHQGPLPDDALPSATVVTRIVYARRAFVRARYVDGRQEEWTFKRYSAQMEVHPTDTLTAFDLGLPATLLRDGLTLVEFPGIPDTGRPVAAVTSPAAVMVLRSDALASQEEMKFAGELLRRTDKLFVVVNIIHKQSADQRLRAFVEHRIQLLRQSPGGDTLDSTIYYIQCRLASVGYLSGDEALVRQSGIQAFEQRLHLWLSDAVSVKATRAISRFAELADVLTLQLEARRTGAERDSDRTVSAGDIEDDLIRVARCRSQFAQNQSDQ